MLTSEQRRLVTREAGKFAASCKVLVDGAVLAALAVAVGPTAAADLGEATYHELVRECTAIYHATLAGQFGPSPAGAPPTP
jgi:hypothetical protein